LQDLSDAHLTASTFSNFEIFGGIERVEKIFWLPYRLYETMKNAISLTLEREGDNIAFAFREYIATDPENRAYEL